MENYKEVQPCGWLHTQGEKFFLLRPYPITGDSWERDSMARFLVVPYIEYEDKDINRYEPNDQGSMKYVYPHARHVVASGFVLEYQADMPIILCEVVKEEYND